MGGLSSGADSAAMKSLDRYAGALGLAFQVRDDILDIEGDSATLGKTAGKDVAQDKATFPALIGMDASRARLRELTVAMDDALDAIWTTRGCIARARPPRGRAQPLIRSAQQRGLVSGSADNGIRRCRP